jgi:nicotinamidase-related amidase
LFNDYYVVVPEDCVASDDRRQHDASLFLMRHRFDVVSSTDILALWQESFQAKQESSNGVIAASESL